MVGVAKLGLRRWFAKPVSLRDSWVRIPPPALFCNWPAKNGAPFEVRQLQLSVPSYKYNDRLKSHIREVLMCLPPKRDEKTTKLSIL